MASKKLGEGEDIGAWELGGILKFVLLH